MYRERALTREESVLAGMIRDWVPRAHQLTACQQVALVAEELRDTANATIGANEIREDVWKSLHFPRYRFFDTAMPFGGWAQFAEDRDGLRA